MPRPAADVMSGRVLPQWMVPSTCLFGVLISGASRVVVSG